MTFFAVDILLLVVSLLVALPAGVLLIEVLASLGATDSNPETHRGGRQRRRPSVAVIVPAHNEELVLTRTLESLIPQLGPGDRLLVIADNCTDRTAELARAAGAECLERHDTERVGKGYALDAGVRLLEGQGGPGGPGGRLPSVVIFNDADVLASPGAIETLAQIAEQTGGPVQGEYLLKPAAVEQNMHAVSYFAFLFKNRVRPRGLWRLGLPCPLHGSGMAFPWAIIRDAPLATADIVEDMKLGVDLCTRGHPPQFCPAARFFGDLPTSDDAVASQRRRWEHGHLATALSIPKLLFRSLLRRDFRSFFLGLDHLVLPLSAFVALLILWTAVTAGWLFVSSSVVAIVAAAVPAGAFIVLMGLAVLAWAGHMRGVVPGKALLGLPLHLVRRLPNQFGFLVRRQDDWVRTPRDGAKPVADPDLRKASGPA